MLGLVLCGGQSTRMGSDKGLLKLEAKTWAQNAIDKLAILDLPVKISVNTQQYIAYSSIFPTEQLITDNLSLAIKGPLLGLLSAHVDNPGEDLFILACDMPIMDPTILKGLLQEYISNTDAEAYVFTNNGEYEPLCGIYRARCLALILSMLKDGKLIKHSMKFMLDHLRVKTMALTEEQKKYFMNFNAHAELNGL